MFAVTASPSSTFEVWESLPGRPSDTGMFDAGGRAGSLISRQTFHRLWAFHRFMGWCRDDQLFVHA